MPIAIEMPKLSDTMTEGTLVRWIKKVGDNVAVGDVLAEVETDKATMEMEAFDEGVLAEIYVQDGNKVEVGQKLAILLGKGEKIESGRFEARSGKQSRAGAKDGSTRSRAAQRTDRDRGACHATGRAEFGIGAFSAGGRRPSQGLAASKKGCRRIGR